MFSHLDKNIHKVVHDLRPFMDDKDKLLQKVEEHCNNPQVKVAYCDDSHFMSSDLVLVSSEAHDYWMGVNVFYVPQIGEPISQFFLYPGHLDSLLQALKHFKKRSKRIQRAEKKVRKKEAKWWMKQALKNGQ